MGKKHKKVVVLPCSGIGKAFGRSRPATGFTLYLRQLADAVRGS